MNTRCLALIAVLLLASSSIVPVARAQAPDAPVDSLSVAEPIPAPVDEPVADPVADPVAEPAPMPEGPAGEAADPAGEPPAPDEIPFDDASIPVEPDAAALDGSAPVPPDEGDPADLPLEDAPATPEEDLPQENEPGNPVDPNAAVAPEDGGVPPADLPSGGAPTGNTGGLPTLEDLNVAGTNHAPAVATAADAEKLLANQASPEAANGDAPALAAPEDAGAGSGKSPAGGFDPMGWLRSAGDKIKGAVAGNEVTLTPEQRAKLEGMRKPLEELAGPNRVFTRADVPEVLQSMRPELGQRVQQEISRRASEKINEGRMPRVRSVFVNAHLRRNYCGYYQQGMAQANGMVSGGLEEFLSGVGAEGQGQADPSTRRNLTIAQLEHFRAGAETLQEIEKQRNSKVKVSFPNGFGVADLDSILKNPNQKPPNGRIGLRSN